MEGAVYCMSASGVCRKGMVVLESQLAVAINLVVLLEVELNDISAVFSAVCFRAATRGER